MHLEKRVDGGGTTLGWMLHDEEGPRLWCGELCRDEFLALPADQRVALRDDLGWYLVDLADDSGSAHRCVLARVSDEISGLKLARAYLSGVRGNGPFLAPLDQRVCGLPLEREA